MVSVVALLCAAVIARSDCTQENAIDVAQVSERCAHAKLASAVRAALFYVLLAALNLHVTPGEVLAQDQNSGDLSNLYPYPEMDPRRHEELRPFHDIVSTWQDKNGKSCCNERDCRIVDDYVVRTNAVTGEEEYSVLVFGRWWTVPREAVRPYSSVGFGVIACYYWSWQLDGTPRPEFRCVVGPHNS